MPKVSVLLSSYNGEKFIKEALDSLLNQTFKDFEIIVINDASTDKTLEILTEYLAKDKRIRVFSNSQNLGLTKSLNKALSLVSSESEFICRMDDDDVCLEKRLEEELKVFELKPSVDVVGCCATLIDNAGKEIGSRIMPETHEEIVKMIHKCNPIIHPTVLIRRVLLEKVGGYSEEFRTSQDYDLYFKLLGSKAIFYNIQNKLLKYRFTRSELKRKSFKYRLNDYNVRKRGYKILELPFYKRVWAFLPLILGVVPLPIYNFFKKLDSRQRM